MFGGRIAAALALVAAGPASTPVETPPVPRAFGFDEAVGICRLAFLEQLQGRPPRAAAARLAALPEAHKRAAAAVCAGYAIGQQDLLAAAEAAREAAAPPPPPKPAEEIEI